MNYLTKQCMVFFLKLKLNYLSKNALPPISFLDTKSTYQDLLSPDSFKPRKNIPVLVSIGDKKSEYLVMCRTYAQ